MIVLCDLMQAAMTAGGDGTGGLRLSLGAKKAAVTPVIAWIEVRRDIVIGCNKVYRPWD